MVAGPEIARAVREFERTYDVWNLADTRHHEQVPSVQKAFAKDVKNLIGVIEEMGNPFCEDSADLLVLDKEIMHKCVMEAVSAAKVKGQSQPITYTIQQCNLPFFGTPEKRQSSTTSNQIADLKSDCRLFPTVHSLPSKRGQSPGIFQARKQLKSTCTFM